MSAGDRVVRVITNDGAFRAIAARTTETVQSAVAAQSATGVTARHFADLLTGVVLYRETMAPQLRVQAILQGAGGRGRLVADSHPDGGTRGLVLLPSGTRDVLLGERAVLQMMRSMPNGALHQGVVEAPDLGGIQGALMSYMQTSEQVFSTISVGCLIEGDRIVAAGGYILQLLPEVSRGPLTVMTERLRDFQDMGALLSGPGSDPGALLHDLLRDMPFTKLAESDLVFQCRCSHARLVESLATLPATDVRELVADGKPLDITCDYCRKAYVIYPEQLRGLLERS